MKVTVELDLERPEGRAAIRAWLDVVEGCAVPAPVAEPCASFRVQAANMMVTGPISPESLDLRAVPSGPSSDEAVEGPAEPPPASEDVTGDDTTDPAGGLLPAGMAEGAADTPVAEAPAAVQGAAGAAPAPEASESAGDTPADDAAGGLDTPAAEASPEITPPLVVSGEADLDPKRPWTDEDKSRAWAMAQGGTPVAAIGRALARDGKQVYMLIWHIRKGKTQPPPAIEGTALVPVSALASAPAVREGDEVPKGFGGVAKDPAVAEKWRDQAEEGARTAFVKRALYPAEGAPR